MWKRFKTAANKVIHTIISNQIDEITTMKSMGRGDFLLQEGNRRVRIYAELMSGPPDRSIYAKSIIRWLPPHENEPLNDEDRQRILEKTCRYFDMRKISYEIIWVANSWQSL